MRDCGYHCAGQSVPSHICDPLVEPPEYAAHRGDLAAAGEPAAEVSPHEMMGHGGHGSMSMAAMVADMRDRFLVAAVLLWSPIGREVFGFTVAAPFGLRDDVFALLLSLPVIFYSAWIFFDGAVRALRARPLDMMVLVAVGVGAGWVYSLVITLIGGGATFAAWALFSDEPLTAALLFAITVVVVTCPDALGLATPTAIATARPPPSTGAGSRSATAG